MHRTKKRHSKIKIRITMKNDKNDSILTIIYALPNFQKNFPKIILILFNILKFYLSLIYICIITSQSSPSAKTRGTNS